MKEKKIIWTGLLVSTLLLASGCGWVENFFKAKEVTALRKEVYTMPMAGEAAIMSGGRMSDEPVKDTIVVATSGETETEILREAARILALKGYELKLDICEDYISPNEKLVKGQVDCNFYQHPAFLERYNIEYDTNLIEKAKIYYQPVAIYGGQTASLAELKEGARVFLPADVTGYARALFLLQQEGLITLVSDADLRSSIEDIDSNYKNLELIPVAEEEMMEKIDETDIMICHTGYALAAGMDPINAALAIEKKDAYTVEWLSKVLVVAKQEEEKIVPLIQVLISEEMERFVLEKYKGSLLMLQEVCQEEIK